MADKCRNEGCRCFAVGSKYNCSDMITAKHIARGMPPSCFTTTPTQSITVERLKKLEDIEKWHNPPEGEWELSAALGRAEAQVAELRKDRERLDVMMMFDFKAVVTVDEQSMVAVSVQIDNSKWVYHGDIRKAMDEAIKQRAKPIREAIDKAITTHLKAKV